MAIIVKANDPTPPAPKPAAEPLSKSVSTSLTATDAERLERVASLFDVSKSSVLRAALLTHLDAIETK